MRRSAFVVGLWCGTLQMSLIYSLSFLWSATPRAGIWVLLSWLLGSMLGVQRGERKVPRLQWAAPCALGVLAVVLDSPSFLWYTLLISSSWGGFSAGHWFAVLEEHFTQALRWEALGMGLGIALSSVFVYGGLDAIWWNCVFATALLVWKEGVWRQETAGASPWLKSS